MEPQRSLLLVGLDPSLVRFTPEWELAAARVRAATGSTTAALEALGFAVTRCVLDLDPASVATLEKVLAGGDFDVVMIGAGLRVPPDTFLLFERVLNLVHRHAPRAVISFNTNPADTAEAARRSLTLGGDVRPPPPADGTSG